MKKNDKTKKAMVCLARMLRNFIMLYKECVQLNQMENANVSCDALY